VANAIHVIVPYRHASTWVFDDPRVGLSQEPFVSGIPEMIDTMVGNIPDAEKWFRLLFASAPFPGTTLLFDAIFKAPCPLQRASQRASIIELLKPTL
jgi:hypothetical protein